MTLDIPIIFFVLSFSNRVLKLSVKLPKILVKLSETILIRPDSLFSDNCILLNGYDLNNYIDLETL